MGADHTTAQASFTELAFGINVAFTFYHKTLEILVVLMEKKLKECSAWLKAFEDVEGKALERTAVRTRKLAENAITRQHRFVQKSSWLSFVCAVACIVILYFDLLQVIGAFEIFLLLPLFFFLFTSVLNFLLFLACENYQMSDVKTYLKAKAKLNLPNLPLPTGSDPGSSQAASPQGTLDIK